MGGDFSSRDPRFTVWGSFAPSHATSLMACAITLSLDQHRLAVSLRMPSTLTDYHAGVVLVGDRAAHSPAAIEQYSCVAFPHPFELEGGRELFFVGHGNPKKCKIGMRVTSPFSCKIDLWYHSRIQSEQIELFVFRSFLEQSRSAPSTC